MRAFLALELSESARQRLLAFTEPWQRSSSGIRWVRPETLHVTLHFLGEITASRARSVGAAVGRVTATIAPFELQLGGCGQFPPRGRPRVLWVGLARGAEAVQDLHQRVGEALAEVGFAAENRPFTPHVTVARVRDSRHRLVPEWSQAEYPADSVGQAAASAPAHSSPVSAIRFVTLMESQLSGLGPSYSEVQRLELDASR